MIPDPVAEGQIGDHLIETFLDLELAAVLYDELGLQPGRFCIVLGDPDGFLRDVDAEQTAAGIEPCPFDEHGTAATAGVYQDVIFDTKPICTISPETA